MYNEFPKLKAQKIFVTMYSGFCFNDAPKCHWLAASKTFPAAIVMGAGMGWEAFLSPKRQKGSHVRPQRAEALQC